MWVLGNKGTLDVDGGVEESPRRFSTLRIFRSTAKRAAVAENDCHAVGSSAQQENELFPRVNGAERVVAPVVMLQKRGEQS